METELALETMPNNKESGDDVTAIEFLKKGEETIKKLCQLFIKYLKQGGGRG